MKRSGRRGPGQKSVVDQAVQPVDAMVALLTVRG